MKIAIMQPYFLPYIGYWQLINTVDTFVIYDNIQYSKKGWFNRNNILLNNKKTIFTIPLKKDSDSLNVVNRFLADDSQKQRLKILGQIKNSYKKAPYFDDTYLLIEDIFLNNETNLFNYTYNSILKICNYLDIDTNIVVSSKINIDHSLKSQEKVIAINKALSATQYINPIGGLELYKTDDFKKENIKLNFLESDVPRYKQFNDEFIPYLSIIDIMMFNSKDDIKEMLKSFTLKGV